jgi:hypothetical protein
MSSIENGIIEYFKMKFESLDKLANTFLMVSLILLSMVNLTQDLGSKQLIFLNAVITSIFSVYTIMKRNETRNELIDFLIK